MEGTIAGFGGEVFRIDGPGAVRVNERQVRRGADAQSAAGYAQDAGWVEAHQAD